MPKVREIADYLAARVPLSLALDLDNVGLLCGFPDREVTRARVMLDITPEGIRRARAQGAELIVAHHPVIFTPLRRVLSDEPEGSRVIALLQAGVSAICMHTNLDIWDGGVNDALAAALGAVGTETLPIGRVAQLAGETPLPDFLATVRTGLDARGIRYFDAGRPVRRVALCGGRDGAIFETAARLGCDTVLTGEIKQNEWLDGRQLGLNLVEAGHFATENVVLPVLLSLLREGFPTLALSRDEAVEPYRVF